MYVRKYDRLALPSFAWLSLLGFDWLCLALLVCTWLCLALPFAWLSPGFVWLSRCLCLASIGFALCLALHVFAALNNT